MCGIAGFKASQGNEETRRETLLHLLEAIHHRGPDHQGYHLDGPIGLGNQRLKIIDLAGGNQPVYSDDGNLVIVYNGEVYNFRELRQELEGRGVSFKTHSDTEVVLKLYEAFGEEAFIRLNGMFAFAIYDKRRDRLVIARDRFGIKPLFYAETPYGFYFSSELKGITQVPGFDRRLDPTALSIYLSQLYIPQPWTAFQGAKRLRAGHYLVLEGHRLQEKKYWDVDFSKKEKISKEEAKDQIIFLLSQSVKRHLISDVPVGMFLSSGLDSLAVLAMGMGHGANLESFTLCFEEKAYDEGGAARRAADLLKSRHHTVLMKEEDFLNGIQRRQDHSAEPVAPWINVGREFLSQYAVDKGFKVVLNGAGGDEFFCGYPTLNAAVLSEYYRKTPKAFQRFTRSVVNRMGAGEGALPISYMAKSFVNAVEPELLRTFLNFKSCINPNQYSGLLSQDAQVQLKGESPYTAFEQYRTKLLDLGSIDAMQYVDIKNFFEGAVLFLGDNATMAVSLEDRVPFLDNDLVEFASRLPVEVKFNLRKVKPLLRESMKQYLKAVGGEKLAQMARKRGFELPGNRWARQGKLKDYLQRELSTSRLMKTGFFDPKGVSEALQKHVSGTQNNERLLQCVLGLNRFLERYQ